MNTPSTATTALSKILTDHDVRITVLDIGAATESYEPFRVACQLLPDHIDLIEIDPDERAFDLSDPKRVKATHIQEAITEQEDLDDINIYLTNVPECSSTLKGDATRLKNFPYAKWFDIEKEISIPATSLNKLSAKLETDFHWIKIDTQGTEHRILDSMSTSLSSAICAVDAEISFYQHYKDADSFPFFHKFMDKQGFYISEIVDMQSRVRLSPADQAQQKVEFPGMVMTTWPTSPELRYMQTFDCEDAITDIKHFLRIWVISFVNQDHSYCFSLIMRLRGSGTAFTGLAEDLTALIGQEAPRKSFLKRLINKIGRRLASW